jgi:hypothetical protein
VHNVVVLTLSEGSGCGDTCGCAQVPRVPVRSCADALRAGGAAVDLVTACSDAEIDAALKPIETGEARLVVAAATDGQVRAVIRRLVRRYAPAPSKRPADLPPDRTLPDLPPVGLLPLLPAVPDLIGSLGLPTDPARVAAATLTGRERRLDLLRQDGGSVTVHGALIGGVDEAGRPVPWRGRVEVDDTVLTDGNDPVLACAITNVGGSDVDGLPLVQAATAEDGMIHVALAVPVVARRLLRRPALRFEVRRARGRAVSVTPRDGDIPLVDDGVALGLNRKRSWWVERSAWAVFVP